MVRRAVRSARNVLGVFVRQVIFAQFAGYLLLTPAIGSAEIVTDPTLTERSTTVKAAHVLELRQAVDLLRTQRGMSPFPYSGESPIAGALVRAVHVGEIRLALDAVFDASVVTRPTYSDASISVGVPIRQLHIQQLRDAITAAMAFPTFTLTVSRTGAGNGTVTSNLSGIACGGACAAGFSSGATVTLTAVAAPGSAFAGWNGACSGAGSCTVAMDQARSVTAAFSSNETGIRAGALDFNGPFPVPGPVSYSDENGQAAVVLAFPGQVIVFFATDTPESDAATAIGSRGASIIGKIPLAGFYLAAVPIGQEAAFIASVRTDPRVQLAVPNTVGSLSAIGVTVLDGCAISHGMTVQTIVTTYGGTFDQCREITTSGTTVSASKVAQALITDAGENGANGTIINLSASGGFNGIDYTTQGTAAQAGAQKAWLNLMRPTLAAVRSLPQNVRDGVVISIAAGNGNMPIDPLMTKLRNDPLLSGTLRDNVLVVTSNQFPLANGTVNDPDVAIMTNPESEFGTSFAAPVAAVVIHNIIARTGASPRTALQAAKRAIANNPGHNLIEPEAIGAISPDGNLSLSGTWVITVRGTARHDDGEVASFGPDTETVPVQQTGTALSAEVLTPEDSLSEVLVQLQAAGCTMNCTPATPNCAIRTVLSGSVVDRSLSFSVTSARSVLISCSGGVSGTLRFDDSELSEYFGTIHDDSTVTGTFTGRLNSSCSGTGALANLFVCLGSANSGTFSAARAPDAIGYCRLDHADDVFCYYMCRQHDGTVGLWTGRKVRGECPGRDHAIPISEINDAHEGW